MVMGWDKTRVAVPIMFTMMNKMDKMADEKMDKM